MANNFNRAQLFNCCTDETAPDWTQFAALETGGCIDNNGETIGGIPDSEAQFWTVYARRHDGCCEAITDCRTRARVNEVARHLSKISGLPLALP